MKVLDIDVPEATLSLWQGWLAPDVQPFFLTEHMADQLPSTADHPNTPVLRGVPPLVSKPHSIRDTFEVWNVDTDLRLVWLDEREFSGLPKRTRAQLVRAQVVNGRGAVPTVRRWSDLLDAHLLRAQADGHRFVWWPSLIAVRPVDVLRRVISDANAPSRHREVSAETWLRCAEVLPEARRLAGTFATDSGPNCFGTVMAAAGVANTEDVWMHQEPFDKWLSESTTPGGDYRAPGTVLVWRNILNVALHAAVSIGGSWVLEKSSQGWSSPRSIRDIADIVQSGRRNGVRLQRHALKRERHSPFR